MPLNEHEQRILDEIERRLAQDDPRLVDQVSRTDLYTHLARRIRIASFAFVIGLVLVLAAPISVWVAVGGFLLMVVSAVLASRYLGQLTRDQLRGLQEGDRLSLSAIAARIVSRLRRPPAAGDEPPRAA
jgi:ABC-type bacteriocin/lantibiotic exporter with double-glycine peptidase domain